MSEVLFKEVVVILDFAVVGAIVVVVALVVVVILVIFSAEELWSPFLGPPTIWR